MENKKKDDDGIRVPGVDFGHGEYALLMRYNKKSQMYQALICKNEGGKTDEDFKAGIPLFLIQMTKPFLKKYIKRLKRLLLVEE